MTAFHHYELLCDADDCDESFNAGESRVSKTREAARQQGWLHVFRPGGYGKGKTAMCADYCPTHHPVLRAAAADAAEQGEKR